MCHLDCVCWGVHPDLDVLPTFEVPLIGVQDAGVHNVYNLTMPSVLGDDYASFVVNSVMVHNCPHEALGLQDVHSNEFIWLYEEFEK
jgi:hypothetical protein